MFSSKINLIRNTLIPFSFFLLFGALSVSKGLVTICEITILILSLDKILIKPKVEKIKEFKFIFVFCTFLLILILGLFWSSDLHQGFRIVKHNHRWLVIPLLLLVNLDLLRPYYSKLLICTVLTAGLAASITVIFSWMPQDNVIWISENAPLIQPYPKSGNNAHFGLYSPFVDRLQFSNLLGLSALATFFLVSSKKAHKSLFLILIPISYCTLILGGRGGQISLFIGGALYLTILLFKFVLPLMTKKMSLGGARFLLITIILVGLITIPVVMLKYNKSLNARYDQMRWELETFQNGTYKQYDYEHFTSVRRIISWQHLGSIFKENPLIGVGTGDVKSALKKKYEEDQYIFPVNTHSQYLYLLAGWGILGFSVFFISWAYWLWKIKEHKHKFVLTYGIVFSVFTLVSMATDAIFIKQVDLMAFITLIAYIGLFPNETIASEHNHSDEKLEV